MARVNAAALVAVLTAVMAAGCGGSATSPPSAQRVSSAPVSATAYVTALCGAVAPFEREIASGAGALNRSGSATLAADRTRLTAYFGALARASSGALSGLDRAGVPSVSGGTAFAATLRSTFARVSSALSRSRTLASNLGTSSDAAFTTGADRLTATVKTSLGQLGSGLATRQNRALNQAAARVSACHTL